MVQVQKPAQARHSSLNTKRVILSTCVKLFLKQGYSGTTLSQIAKEAGVSMSSFQNIFGNKEGVLLDLAKIMFENQFEAAKASGESINNPLYIYAAETAVQLTLTELNENIRDVYVAAYSNGAASEYIYTHTAKKLCETFLKYNPNYTESDFYECDIGSAGMMRGFMSRRCDQYFTLEKKLTRFLTMTLRAYNVPKEEINGAIAFVLSLNIRTLSEGILQRLFEQLAVQFHFELV